MKAGETATRTRMAEMAKRTKANESKESDEQASPGKSGITRIMVRDFKSLAGEHSIEVRPLTILAGANSSGKSSIMQPLLLMKQTLDAPYDPGPLLLDGPNVKFTKSEQFFSNVRQRSKSSSFSTGIMIGGGPSVECAFSKSRNSKFIDIVETIYISRGEIWRINNQTSYDELANQLITNWHLYKKSNNDTVQIFRERCFIFAEFAMRRPDFDGEISIYLYEYFIDDELSADIKRMIHVPGLRGNPQRTYPLASIEDSFDGTFEKYAASLIYRWVKEDKAGHLARLSTDIQALGLASKVIAYPVDETQFELRVGRLPSPSRGSSRNLVSIADVGFGVSQTLPVLVALHAAQPGQLVYIEQPEIHLHPRAQTAMSQVLANAAMRGARLVIETHSDLLLLGIQTLIAEGKLPPELVKLHWFERDKDGLSKITSRDLDERGRFGDWPEDFGEVQMAAQRRYLDAAEFRAGSE